MIKKILIANRGEIARRIIRTAKKIGIQTVTVYTPEEKESAWCKESDFSISLGNGDLAETYLNKEKLVQLAIENQCDAIHPGYGFLSENAAFAQLCQDAGINFIGPKPEVIELMGNKQRACQFVQGIGIPVPSGFSGTPEELVSKVGQMTLPVIIKASAGGGGKGMHIVYQKDELKEKIEKASHEAQLWFGNGAIYIEQYFENARHIEVQVLGDEHGNYLHLFERECSLQRNYQKIIEEAPSPTLSAEQRKSITDAALKIASQAGYTHAGTIEFLWNNGQFYFLEMNTRIQVEHPVTELITGVDLVEHQINISNHLSLNLHQKDIHINGHAIQARIYAENPEQDFRPDAGTIHEYTEPVTMPVRLDTTYREPASVSSQFDGLIGKVIAHTATREKAIEMLVKALKNYTIHGIHQNISFLIRLLESSEIRQNQFNTRFLTTHLQQLIQDLDTAKKTVDLGIPIAGFLLGFLYKGHENPGNLWEFLGNQPQNEIRHLYIDDKLIKIKTIKQNAQLHFEWNNVNYQIELMSRNNNRLVVVINGMQHHLMVSEGSDSVWVQVKEHIFRIRSQEALKYVSISKNSEKKPDLNDFEIRSPLHGKISEIFITEGQQVNQGMLLLSIESMKTENKITSPGSGKVNRIWIEKNHTIKEDQVLISIEN